MLFTLGMATHDNDDEPFSFGSIGWQANLIVSKLRNERRLKESADNHEPHETQAKEDHETNGKNQQHRVAAVAVR